MLLVLANVAGCPKKDVLNASEAALQGMWIRVDDTPGLQPADTIRFFTKNGKNLMAFKCVGCPATIAPAHIETEFKFENSILSFRDYTGQSNDFRNVESFQWITSEKEFSVKLYQFLVFMSADYRVNYKKVQ